MKTKLKLLAALLSALLFLGEGLVLRSYAQDFHLSQYTAASQYLNPALTGVYFDRQPSYRIYSDYRSQWRSLGGKPFSTYYLAYDMPYKQFGLGGYLISNRNGMGGLNTINVMPSASYRVTKSETGPHYLSVGLQMGILYKSFNPNRFTYEKQYSPDASTVFDPSVSSGENFNKINSLKPDANMGVFYKYKDVERKVHPWLGFAVYHVTKPNESLTGFAKSKLPMRWVYQVGADYEANEKIIVTPMILYMGQAKAHELNLGVIMSYQLKEDGMYCLIGGLNYRNKDAFIIQAGMKYDRHLFTFSYDINTSYLSAYTNGRGAFELSILLTGIKGKPLFNPKFGKN